MVDDSTFTAFIDPMGPGLSSQRLAGLSDFRPPPLAGLVEQVDQLAHAGDKFLHFALAQFVELVVRQLELELGLDV